MIHELKTHAFKLKQVGEEVAKVDGMIGALLTALAEAHLDDKVNVVVTSTPGFSGVRPGLIGINHYCPKKLDCFIFSLKRELNLTQRPTWDPQDSGRC
jgi:hypothetical protein